MSQVQGNPVDRLRPSILQWYDANHRDLPWRHTQDPYAVWVSEVMLQQTRVAVAVERYKSFLARFPDINALAAAAEQDVLAQWSGLGYYRRARMLHKAAQFVAERLNGRFPTTAAELRNLPGIGPYTAAAIASIACGERVAVVDGNVERVLSRLEGWEATDSASQGALRRRVGALAAQLVDPARPGDFNQALMELGATVCTPRKPQCPICPWAGGCRTLGEHRTPRRPPMTSHEVVVALCVRSLKGRGSKRKPGSPEQGHHEVLLEQRPDSHSVMPGLWELPHVSDAVVPESELRMTVRHAIMQVNYVVRVRAVPAEGADAIPKSGVQRRWVPLDVAAGMALTGLARKVLSRANLLPGNGRATHATIAVRPAAEVS
jgi:A/G-specific adenine glycosylase